MTSIKTYLLPLFLLLFLSISAFSQSTLVRGTVVQHQRFSKADSVLAATYLTEREYNELNGVGDMSETACSKPFYGDEIYNEEPVRSTKRRNHFWDAVAVELVVEVLVNTTFLIATLWH